MTFHYSQIVQSWDKATVKPVLSGHPWDLCWCPINRGVCLIQVCFTEYKGEKLGLTKAGIFLMQGVHLIWTPLNKVSLYLLDESPFSSNTCNYYYDQLCYPT